MSKVPVFDIGDTLFPTRKFFREAVKEDVDSDEFRIGNFNIFDPEKSEAYFEQKGISINGEKVAKAYRRKVKDFMVEQGRLEMLRKCSEELGPIGIISDNWTEAGKMYKEMFQQHGIKFKGIVISQTIGHSKPEKEIFEAFLDKRNRPANKFVYFGNHGERDPAAEKLGMDFVFTTEFDNFGTSYEGRKVSNLDFNTVKQEVNRK